MSKQTLSRKHLAKGVKSSPVPKLPKTPKSLNWFRQSAVNTTKSRGQTSRKLFQKPKWASPRNICLDLEISPQESMTYGKFHEASVLSVVRAPYIFCFAYMEINGKKPKVVSLIDFPLYKKDPYNDREVVKALYAVMSEADIITAHNNRFDSGIARGRFIYHGLPPIKPYKTVCTLQMARKVGTFPSNSLKEVALFLGIKEKMETSKYLWQKIHRDHDPKAWREMIKYNAIDVEVCAQIFHRLTGWTGKAVKAEYNGVCKNCGSSDYILRGQAQSGGHRASCRHCLIWFTLK